MFSRILAVLLFVSSFCLLSLALASPKRQPPAPSNLEVLQPSLMGVSDTFKNYAQQNAPPFEKVYGVEEKEEPEFEIPNQFYIPRGSGPKQPYAPRPGAVAGPSTMYNQTVNGLLPVTLLANYVGLG